MSNAREYVETVPLSHFGLTNKAHTQWWRLWFCESFLPSRLSYKRNHKKAARVYVHPDRRINVFLWRKLINVCLPKSPHPHFFKLNSFCVVLIVGFSNFLHSRISNSKSNFRFLSASIKSPKRIFLHRILFLSMLSLRFWKRNKKMSKFFQIDCERN